MSRQPPPNHERDHRAFGADAIIDQDKHLVGGTGNATFEGTWSGTVWYGMAVGGYTLVEGEPTGGTTGATVFLLPSDYRPDDDVYDISRGTAVGDISFWKVESSTGAVVYEGSGSVTVS